MFGPDPRADLLTEALGSRWMIKEIAVKPYAACSDIHPMIQATLELREEHRLTSEMITRIEAEGPTKATVQHSMDGTVSTMSAQYSDEFNVAAAILADPRDPATCSPEGITDPSIAGLQAKVVSVRPAPEFDDTYAWKMGRRVRIHLIDGEMLERTIHSQKGSMHDPLGAEEFDVRLRALTTGRAPTGKVAALRVVPDEPDRKVADLTFVLRGNDPRTAGVS